MTTQHPLGRIKQPDSRNYLIRELLKPEFLATPTQSINWGDPVCLDQGNVGSCTGNAQAGDMAADPVRIANITEQIALRIYHQAQLFDGIPLPHEGSSVLAAVKAVQKLYPGAVKAYHFAKTTQEVRAALHQYGPIITGADWWTGMDTPDAHGIVSVTGTIRGEHSWLIHGDDVHRDLAICMNSWGRHYGRAGQFYIPWKQMPKLVDASDSDWLVITDRRLITV